jgi:hypothetical protein
MAFAEWKTAYKKEAWGDKGSYGIEIRVSVNRPLNENDSVAFDKLGDQAEAALMAETMRLDPKEQARKFEERNKLLALFGNEVDPFLTARGIYVEEIPNGYCPRWCCSQRPWYKVTTNRGVITLGWRKHVIEITWGPAAGGTADELFPGEDVTKYDRTIHAWGYDKAGEYIAKILS